MRAFERAIPALAALAVSSLHAGCRPPGDVQSPHEGKLTVRVVTAGLDNPFEITMGPDGQLWVTERTGKRVIRVAPSDGAKAIALAIPEVLVTPMTQDGLLGMALHPRLLTGTGEDFVYLAYTYDADPAPDKTDRRVKITRWLWDPIGNSLGGKVDLITGLPGSGDHNSGRLVFGPDEKLYYTIGDQGHNQLDYYCDKNRAQEIPSEEEVAASDWTRYQGKVLRLSLDGSIPDDNPMIAAVKSHIFSYGHRNAQGLVFGPDGTLYESEHGPKTDDEINIIEAGKNYGWPHVAGYRDNQSYFYANWSAAQNPPCEQLEYSDFEVPKNVPFHHETQWSHPDFRPPEKTFYTVMNGHNFKDPACAEGDLYYLCWPTVAPSSLDYYGAYPDGIVGLEGSLLMTTLKRGTLFRIELGLDGRPTKRPAVPLLRTVDRYRDTAIAPDGKTIFLATDSAGNVLGLDGRPTQELEHPGAILALRAPD